MLYNCVRYNLICMKKKILLFIPFVILSACSPPAPEQLAKDSCDCFAKAKAISNSDEQVEQTQNCMNGVQLDMARLKEIEKDKDMDDNQVQAFEERYNKVYNNCK